MAVGEKIRVEICGTQRDVKGETTELVTTAQGEYFARGAHHYIRYEDDMLSDSERVPTLLKFDERALLLRRSGLVTSEQRFSQGATTTSDYATPYGTLTLGIHTTSYCAEFADGRGRVAIDYELLINGAKQSDNQLRLTLELINN